MSNISDRIRCADCRYVRQDKAASDYTRKSCGKCEHHKSCVFEKTDKICPKQTIKWAAYECGCAESDYFLALLNVTRDGGRLPCVTWRGCEDGVRRTGV